MLILSREEGERIVIGDPKNPMGTITIFQIKGGRARIGFDFPKAIPIHRQEVANAIKAGNTRPIPQTPNADR